MRAIPFLREFARDLKVPFNEVPYISIGASLGNYAHFTGENFAGKGTGTGQVHISTSSGQSVANKLMDEVLQQLGKDETLPFVVVQPGTLSKSGKGAFLPALFAGMPVMNLVGTVRGRFHGRFHLPADAGVSSVNLTSLLSLTLGFSRALKTAMCSPQLLQPSAWSNQINWLFEWR